MQAINSCSSRDHLLMELLQSRLRDPRLPRSNLGMDNGSRSALEAGLILCCVHNSIDNAEARLASLGPVTGVGDC